MNLLDAKGSVILSIAVVQLAANKKRKAYLGINLLKENMRNFCLMNFFFFKGWLV